MSSDWKFSDVCRGYRSGTSVKIGLKKVFFIKKGLEHKCFLVKVAKFLRTLTLKNTANSCLYALLQTFRQKSVD